MLGTQPWLKRSVHPKHLLKLLIESKISKHETSKTAASRAIIRRTAELSDCVGARGNPERCHAPCFWASTLQRCSQKSWTTWLNDDTVGRAWRNKNSGVRPDVAECCDDSEEAYGRGPCHIASAKMTVRACKRSILNILEKSKIHPKITSELGNEKCSISGAGNPITGPASRLFLVKTVD